MRKHLQPIVEWSIAIILLIALIYPYTSYGSFTSLKAHQKSEKSFHYGPSEILEEIDFPKGKIYLCKYDKWISANTIRKKFIKWYPGSGVAGYPINKNEQISCTWEGSSITDDYYLQKIYGYVRNDQIVKVTLEVEVRSGDTNEWENQYEKETKVLEYTLKDHRAFIFFWNDKEKKYRTKMLKGIDKDGNVLYKYSYH